MEIAGICAFAASVSPWTDWLHNTYELLRLRPRVPRAILEEMKSPLFVLILIVNLLTCPLRCLACESHSSSSDEIACASCECCSHCEDLPNSDDTEPHDPDCGCKSCICEGAVVVNPVELPDSGDSIGWFLTVHLEMPVPSPSTGFFSNHWSEHSGCILSGRDARIAYQSWQI